MQEFDLQIIIQVDNNGFRNADQGWLLSQLRNT